MPGKIRKAWPAACAVTGVNLKSLKLRVYKIVVRVADKIGVGQELGRIIAIPLYRNAFYLMLNTAVTSFFGFFFWMIIARFYSETEVGYGSAAISAINLITVLSMLGMSSSIIRFLSQSDRPRDLINSVLTMGGLISLIVAAIFVAGLDFWSPALSFIKQNVIFALAFLVTAMLSTLSPLLDSVFVARRRANLVLVRGTIFSLLKVPLPIVLAGFFHTFGVVASWGVALGISLLICLFLFLPRIESGYSPVPTLSLSHLKVIRGYSGSSYLAGLLSVAPAMILPLMVVNILGTESNAYFYIAFMIANLLHAIPYSVSRSLFAEGSYLQKNIKENVMGCLKFIFLLLIPALIVLLVAGKWVLLAFGQGYATNALRLLWLFSLSSLPCGIISIYIALLRVQYRLKEMVLIRGFTAVAELGLSFLAMSVYGIIGIGYAWLGVEVVVAVALAIRLRTGAGMFSRSE
ncbi:MAG: hypothetical protein U9Q17_01445 [Chloroflexota bacterium]|nr:hypothetical protein [Chloroflexota bacterium]